MKSRTPWPSRNAARWKPVEEVERFVVMKEVPA